MVESKWIGLGLAVSSSFFLGSSFVLTKMGLISAAERAPTGFNASDSYSYLRNSTWWAGMTFMVVGEIANFAAYTAAPAILVTPLGALSVLVGAVLASIFLKEELGRIGRIGCSLCILGSAVIVLHAPEDKDVETVDEILGYAMRPMFMLYCLFVLGYSLFIIHRVAPKWGNREPVVYLSICSLVGSVSVMAIKGFGVAIKLTLAGNNQLTHLPTYVFGIVTAGCIVVQMNYFNKALDLFSTNVVNPIYYVGFSTSTIIASTILFQGLNTSDAVTTITLLLGFVVIFLGVYLLNISRGDPHGIVHNKSTAYRHSLMETRMSMSGAPEDPRSMATPRSARFASSAIHDLEHGGKHVRIATGSDEGDDAAMRLTDDLGDSEDEDEVDELPRSGPATNGRMSSPTSPRRTRDPMVNGTAGSPKGLR